MTNRIIKFRAWDKENGRMTTMPVVEFTENTWIAREHRIVPPDEVTRTICDSNGVLMQFTGLHDKNGKVEVYEGDIMQDKEAPMKGIDEFGEVVFLDGKFQLKMRKVGIEGYNFFDLKNCIDDFEVIGNIYENPELLK